MSSSFDWLEPMSNLPPRHVLLPMLASLREQLAAIHGDALADEELLATTLDSTSNALDLLRGVARSAIQQETLMQALNARINQMRQRRDRLEAHAEACRATTRDGMEALGLKRLEDPEFTATVGASPASVIITDIGALPKNMRRVKIEADKVALMKALKAGQWIAGAELSNGASTLTIRRS